jgi:anti-sigma factor RsiW
MSLVTCQELIAILDDYVAGALEPSRREQLDRHLAVCRSCVEYLKGYREAIRLAKATATDADFDTLPPEVLAAILAAAGEK